uniref:Autophagy protein 5 n=1 Tax=Timema californicum TaxID=61474 RepID=A0A7R9JBG2_TIMCA|nr:unnamed protein product [Timema californicum]
MANDREVLREIWEGRLPICFQLDSEEVYDLQAPDPYYLMVPRLSYFPLVTDKIRKHFIRHVHPDKQEAEMWLDYNGQPLKWWRCQSGIDATNCVSWHSDWQRCQMCHAPLGSVLCNWQHYPIGVLFDMYVTTDLQLPWNITVHFDKFPEDELLHCPSRDAVESHFMACVKEADVLKHRSQVVSNMQKKDHNQLWLGLQNDKFDQFWAVNRKLMEASADEAFKYIPFRCYHGDEAFVQRLVRPVTEEGHRKTLKDLVHEVFPEEAEGRKTQHSLLTIFRSSPVTGTNILKSSLVVIDVTSLNCIAHSFLVEDFLLVYILQPPILYTAQQLFLLSSSQLGSLYCLQCRFHSCFTICILLLSFAVKAQHSDSFIKLGVKIVFMILTLSFN